MDIKRSNLFVLERGDVKLPYHDLQTTNGYFLKHIIYADRLCLRKIQNGRCPTILYSKTKWLCLKGHNYFLVHYVHVSKKIYLWR